VKRTNGWPRVLEVDYSAARAQAIRWLGDRYLLAKPLNWNHCAGCNVPLTKAELPLMGLSVQHANETSGSPVDIDTRFATETMAENHGVKRRAESVRP
jgi:hypothetical protein